MIDQDRMMRFRSELHGIGDLDRVSGTQMLFAFQRFAAIVLDGETAEVAEPMTASSSDDVPHDEPALGDEPNVLPRWDVTVTDVTSTTITYPSDGSAPVITRDEVPDAIAPPPDDAPSAPAPVDAEEPAVADAAPEAQPEGGSGPSSDAPQ